MSQFCKIHASATLNQTWKTKQSFSSKVRTVFLSLKNSQQNFVKSKHTSFSKGLDEKEVVLFQYENPRYFLLMNLGSAIQCGFWTYLGVFLFQSLKASDVDVKKKEFWDSVTEKKRGYGDILSGVALVFGWTMFSATCFYSLRSVRKLIFHKRERALTIVTYNLPGFNTIKVPLNSVSSNEHRTKAKKFIPMKVKHKLFYYLLDVGGEFCNPELFDCTAGIRRNL